jgi:hypothetical protein
MLYNQDWGKKPNPVSDLLNSAADAIEKFGHTQNQMQDHRTGSMYLMGALWYVQSGNAWMIDSESKQLALKAAKAICDFKGLPHADFPLAAAVNWNNAWGRTGREVVETMRLTAAKLKEKEHAI